jgi:hypothetical protein
MLTILPKFVRRIYRKEPISSFILIVGAVDALMGGLEGKWDLFSFGAVILFFALGIRWWYLQNGEVKSLDKMPKRYLPPSSSSQPLPVLVKEKNYKS